VLHGIVRRGEHDDWSSSSGETKVALRDITPAQKAVYGVFQLWIQQALKSDGSIFTPGKPVWSVANLDALNRDFVEKPDLTKDTFIEKLERQLQHSSDGAVQLCAEMLFLHLLITARVGAASKLETVQQVLNLMSEPVDVPEKLLPALDGGLCSPGPAFNSRRPHYLFQLISFMRAWKALSSSEQDSLLRDPWGFKAFVYKAPVDGAHAQRHALCHYVHPEYFEIIVSGVHKKRIVDGFEDLLSKRYDDVDQAIYAIRQELQKGRDETIDFYADEEIHRRWWTDTKIERNRSFWWVNQGKTYAAERDGGYIWAPQRTKTGASPYYFWENVSRVSAGDIIFHYEGGAVRAVSIATERGYESDRPPELPSVEWDTTGWKADCDYAELAEPIPLVAVQSRLAEMQIDKGPVNDTGRVNQGYVYGLSAEAASFLAKHLHPSELPTDIAQALDLKSSGKSMEPTDDLNVIYYGPPGTGKTYLTAQRAIEIIDGSAPKDRAAVMKRFRELRESEQVAFVTFHQSYSYEEFVEGIRPILTDADKDSEVEASESSTVRYECKPGVFRRICERAELVGPKPAPTFALDLSKTKVWKMSLGASWDAKEEWVFDESIEQKRVLLGWGGAIDFSGCDTPDAIAERFRESEDEPPKEFAIRAVDRFKNSISVGDLVVVSDGNLKFRAIGRITGAYFHIAREDYSQARPVEWLLVLDESRSSDIIMKKVFSQATIYELKPKVLKLEGLRSVLSPEQPSKPRRYVLIIDEINRGNIAKILGELITLLEPDKRLGAPNEIRTILPYSGTEFGVPSNLYVIGTMNTADRSIAFLDTALRRRFRFQEMMPDPQVVRDIVGDNGVLDGVDVVELLSALNQRIELVYDRDHALGHSFFLEVRSLEDLRDVFLHRVIPLLQEYFYDDWSKICIALGCPYNDLKTRNPFPLLQAQELSAETLLGDTDDFESKTRFQINPAFRSAGSSGLRDFFNAVVQLSAR